jgi:hypothetical protein
LLGGHVPKRLKMRAVDVVLVGIDGMLLVRRHANNLHTHRSELC